MKRRHLILSIIVATLLVAIFVIFFKDMVFTTVPIGIEECTSTEPSTFEEYKSMVEKFSGMTCSDMVVNDTRFLSTSSICTYTTNSTILSQLPSDYIYDYQGVIISNNTAVILIGNISNFIIGASQYPYYKVTYWNKMIYYDIGNSSTIITRDKSGVIMFKNQNTLDKYFQEYIHCGRCHILSNWTCKEIFTSECVGNNSFTNNQSCYNEIYRRKGCRIDEHCTHEIDAPNTCDIFFKPHKTIETGVCGRTACEYAYIISQPCSNFILFLQQFKVYILIFLVSSVAIILVLLFKKH